MYFFLISSYYRNAGVTFDLLMRKKSMGKIMGLMLEEVIMSDGQMYSFLQLFNTEKNSLIWTLDSTLTDFVLLILIVIPLW